MVAISRQDQKVLAFVPASLVIFLGFYIPFEDYIAYILPLNEQFQFVLKQGSELVLYGLLLIILLDRLQKNALQKSPIDLHVFGIVVVGVISTISYSNSYFDAFNNMRALLRHLAVFYIVYYTGFSLQSWRQLTKLILIVVTINMILSLAQFSLGESFPSFLKMEEKMRLSLEVPSGIQLIQKQEKIGAVRGVFEAPGVLGMFLVISVNILMCRYRAPENKSKLLYLVFFAFIFIVVFLTYSKASFIISVVASVLFLYFNSRKLRSVIRLAVFFGAAILIVVFFSVSVFVSRHEAKKEEVTAAQNIVNLLSSEYWRHFFAAERGWVVTEVGKSIVLSTPLIGFSPDPDAAKREIVAASGGGIDRLIGYVAFEDVYWVALLGFYGFVGFFIFFVLFFKLYQRAHALLDYAYKHGDVDARLISSAFLSTLLLLIPFCFFERVLEVKVFSFYLWLMAGMVMRISGRKEKGEKVQNQNISGFHERGLFTKSSWRRAYPNNSV